MENNLESSLKAILHHEGGYVNHPKDPGGETNLGVTKRVYEEYGGKKDMKDLVVADVAPIYIDRYWGKMKCYDLPSGLDLCVFDFGVNAGPGRAAKFLQRMIGTTVDGGIGPNTIRAAKNLKDWELQVERSGFYWNLVFDGSRYTKRTSQVKFIRGWIRRCFNLQ